jgi:hypothetical protein
MPGSGSPSWLWSQVCAPAQGPSLADTGADAAMPLTASPVCLTRAARMLRMSCTGGLPSTGEGPGSAKSRQHAQPRR